MVDVRVCFVPVFGMFSLSVLMLVFKMSPLQVAVVPQYQFSFSSCNNKTSIILVNAATINNKAFEEAWQRACTSPEEATLILVPINTTYYLNPIVFSGPCKSSLTIKIYGTIRASKKVSDYNNDRRHWIVFKHVDNLSLEGSGGGASFGTIHGNGHIWWNISCRLNNSLPCKPAPTAVTFRECNNLRVTDLRIKNAQQKHLTFQKCANVKAFNLRITAPKHSPNTDGIHVTESHNVHLANCVIKTGDDCISIVRWSKNIRATDITCGPGHGISIGSLGWRNSEDRISGVVVNRAKLLGTSNGVRIKTWQGGSGYAKDIRFENIVMRNVKRPILIDQNYCDRPQDQDPNECREQGSAVQISNVVYRNIRISSDSSVALKLECSRQFPCTHILMHNVLLFSPNKSTSHLQASCHNVVGLYSTGNLFPNCSRHDIILNN